MTFGRGSLISVTLLSIRIRASDRRYTKRSVFGYGRFEIIPAKIQQVTT